MPTTDKAAERMVCNAVWAGKQMGPIHAACLSSFLRAGHPVHLYVYEKVSDAPVGVVQIDANSLLPWPRVENFIKAKRYDIFSDSFRYSVLKAGLGCYIDCDIYCLKPLEKSDFIMAWEETNSINGAILLLSPDCEMLTKLHDLLDSKSPPKWVRLGRRKRLNLYLKALLGRASLTDFRWGVIGPDALTWFVKEYKLEHRVLPADYFYPVHFLRVRDLLDPELTIEDLTTHRTRCIHLYNECLRNEISGSIPPTSPLGRMLSAGQ